MEETGKRRIGIITIARVNNYGAELQAFATQFFLRKNGYDAEIIDYLFYKHPHHVRTPRSKPVFRISAVNRLKEWFYPLFTRIKSWVRHDKVAEERLANFNRFHQDNTRFSREYRSIDALYSAQMDYDVFMVGSDQVWNPNNYTSLDPYFLGFAPAGRKRVSYASSFGLNSLPQSTYGYYRQMLQCLDAISVREENAVEIVRSISGLNATWVLDPTLLLDRNDWRKIERRIEGIPEKYVLVYEITPCPQIFDVTKYVASCLNAAIVCLSRVSGIVREPQMTNVETAGPAEFISLFDQAAFIVTNSFHGTAFSINFEKDFFVVVPSRKQNNSRQVSILNKMGLTDRLITSESSYHSVPLEIDYAEVLPRLEIARKESADYLKAALDE